MLSYVPVKIAQLTRVQHLRPWKLHVQSVPRRTCAYMSRSCKSVSNSYFKPARLQFSTKGDPITAKLLFRGTPPQTVLTAGARHAAKSSCSWDRTTAERAVRQNKHRIKPDLLGRSTKCCEAAGGEQIRDAAAERHSTSRPVIRSDSVLKTTWRQNPPDFSDLTHKDQ